MADDKGKAKKINATIDSILWKLIGGTILLILVRAYLPAILIVLVLLGSIALAIYLGVRFSRERREHAEYRRTHP
jgi:asparagine N-glycosylation enzyme membrane subunit Stt3